RRAAAYARPSRSSPVVAIVPRRFSGVPYRAKLLPNLVLVLGEKQLPDRETWYRVRAALLPNNTVVWMRARSLGSLHHVTTHLYVNKKRLTATLTVDGRVVFTTRVGVGKARAPTPSGQFVVRARL